MPLRWRRARPRGPRPRWRLEVCSTDDGAARLLAGPDDVPFPLRVVDGAPAGPSGPAWARPRVVLEVEATDPFAPETLRGLLGTTGYRVRYVTGDELVVDHGPVRLRIRATGLRADGALPGEAPPRSV